MSAPDSFKKLGLIPDILPALSELGYEVPTPIQQATIPVLLAGRDLLAQAQTGTGKTAAFALPVLSNLSLDQNYPQAIILTPTRELAIQVAQAIKSYAKHMSGFQVLPIYGGQDYRTQLKALKRGVHVVVGTPGRVMDHLRRETLSIAQLKMVVLDEADEMLKMGFIDDVKWILQQIDTKHQTALFSATMPPAIKKVADQYLHNAEKIHIQSKTTTVEAIEQFYTIVSKHHKIEALTRFLETEEIDAMLIFSRTKVGTVEVTEKLEALGYAVAAMNGDLNQKQREHVISKLKRGGLDIVVATEVAARGLDVSRISHVVNYDAPHDAESYTHRIGRTGRAGRKGKAFLFVSPKERAILRDIERITRQELKQIDPPSYNQINKKRTENFTDSVLKILATNDLDYHREYIENLVHTSEHSELDIAAALASMLKTIKPVAAGKEIEEKKFDDEPARVSKRKPRRDFNRKSDFKGNHKGDFKSKSNSNSKSDFKSTDKSDFKRKPKKNAKNTSNESFNPNRKPKTEKRIRRKPEKARA